MHKGMMRQFRNTAYMNLDTGDITKKKSVARAWEEDGFDVEEVVCTVVRDCWYDDDFDKFCNEQAVFRTMKA